MKFKIVCVSDTHNRTPDLPEGDLLIHAGDLTVRGFRIEMYRQLGWLESQRNKFKYAAMTIGNHDLHAEEHLDDVKDAAAEIGFTLLHNEGLTLPNGLKLWGSAHTPNYHDWAFMLEPSEIFEAWDKIPKDTDILITHGPPKGILDDSYRGPGIGCPELLNKVKEINPKVHVFGHAHQGKGILQIGPTLFVNAATTVTVIEIDV